MWLAISHTRTYNAWLEKNSSWVAYVINTRKEQVWRSQSMYGNECIVNSNDQQLTWYTSWPAKSHMLNFTSGGLRRVKCKSWESGMKDKKKDKKRKPKLRTNRSLQSRPYVFVNLNCSIHVMIFVTALVHSWLPSINVYPNGSIVLIGNPCITAFREPFNYACFSR